MSSSLLLTRRFAPLFWTQFFSAFSDNFLKNSLVFLILFHIGGSDAEALITLAAAVFIAPYFFLSALGGELADRYDKAVVARRLKFAEIGIAFLAVLGFGIHSVLLLFIALFLFGVIASLFGPIKYGILPDHLARSELPAGNALVEGATFIAILLGTIVGGVAAKDGGDPFHFAFLMIVFSLMCWGASLLIPRTGQAAPNLVVQKNILASTAGLLKFLRADPRLLWGALVTSWFWLVGAVALSLMPPLVKNVLGGNEEVVTACLAIFSIFIAVGSGLAAWLAAGRIILLPTLIGAVLLGLFAIDLGWSTHGAAPIPHLDGYLAILGSARGLRFALDLAGLAIAGGLFIVPTFAAVQAWAGADRRARVVAAVNVLNAAFMAGSTVIVAILQKSGMTTSQLFILLGVASLLVAIAVGRTMPASALSDALSIIYRALFRIEVRGLDNLNKAGPNVIIALNHVSFLDAGLALSLRDREPVFAIDVGIATEVVGAPVREAHERDAARSDEADGHSLPDRCGQRRESPDHLSGGTHHRHRQPDEGLRRRRHDRGQGRCRDRARAHRGPGADAVQPIVQGTGAPALVPQSDGDDSRTGAAHRRPRPQGPQAPAGGGGGTLRHHVGPGLPHHVDRPHRDASGDPGRRDPRPPSRRRRRSRHRRAHLQASPHRRRHPRQQADADGRGGARRRRHAAERKWRGGHASSG